MWAEVWNRRLTPEHGLETDARPPIPENRHPVHPSRSARTSLYSKRRSPQNGRRKEVQTVVEGGRRCTERAQWQGFPGTKPCDARAIPMIPWNTRPTRVDPASPAEAVRGLES